MTKKRLPLFVIGEYGWKSSAVRRKLLDNNQDVRWLGKICDSSLKFLYSSAKVFISASKAEGFNLPVREALSFGVPVVISDIPIHRELYRDEAFFFTFDSTESFKKAIISAIDSQEKVNLSVKVLEDLSIQSLAVLRKAIEKIV
jgi:glycosyltransferase involved in cell wall biosynthesis